MALSVELSFTNLIIGAFLFICAKKGWKLFRDWKKQELLDKWNNTLKDKVILHGIARGKALPSISPFCLKLETYLRFAQIPYEFEASDPFGPKGKSPWISYNGSHIADSQLIIQFLNKKFSVDLNTHLTPDQREICRAVRVMLENHFMLYAVTSGLASWRWIENFNSIDQIMKFPSKMKMLMFLQSKKVEKSLYAQGLGRHTLSDRTEMTLADLRSVSVILGGKKFMGGDAPCEEDCAVFGSLAQVIWAAPGSPYEQLVEDELLNLKHYCERMKEKFWPDWDTCLDKTTDYY